MASLNTQAQDLTKEPPALAQSPCFSLGDYLLPLENRLLGNIVDLPHLLKLQDMANAIPGPTSAFFGFEVPMAAPSRDADFLFCSTQDESHAKILAGLHEKVKMPEHLFELEAWCKVRQFCRTWEDRSKPLYNRLRNIWLEFDVGQSAAPHSPSLFFGTPTELYRQREKNNALVLDTLTQLSTDTVTGKRGERLKRILKALPEGAYVFQVGMMLSRDVAAVRICLRNIAPAKLADFLTDIEWPGCQATLNEVLSRYSDRCTSVALDLDVGEQVWDKIGLECSFGKSADSLPLMQAFCAACVEDGLTSKAKANALIAYNGLVHQDEDPGKWPEHLHKTALLRGKNMFNYISCWIHHIKLVLETGTPLSAKAYLAAMPDQADRKEFRARLKEMGVS